VHDVTESLIPKIETGFRFLQSEYGFAKAFSRQDEKMPPRGCWVQYESPTTVVSVVIDEWGRVLAPEIGRAKDRTDADAVGNISLRQVYEYETTTAEERALLLSQDLSVLSNGLEVVRKRALAFSSLIGSEASPDGDFQTARQIEAHARLLRQYGEPLLRGDFSSWLAIHEYALRWLVAGEMVSGRFSERGRGGGVTASEAEARFWRSREYIEALREEFGGK
jgi:hypothetical protein